MLKPVYTHLANINFKKAEVITISTISTTFFVFTAILLSLFVHTNQQASFMHKSPIGLYLYLLTIPETSEICLSQYFLSLESYYLFIYLLSVSLNENSAPLINHNLGEFKKHLSITHLSFFSILTYLEIITS